MSILYFASYTLDLGQEGRSRYSRWREPRELYIHELFDFNNTWESDGVTDRGRLKRNAEAEALDAMRAHIAEGSRDIADRRVSDFDAEEIKRLGRELLAKSGPSA